MTQPSPISLWQPNSVKGDSILLVLLDLYPRTGGVMASPVWVRLV